MADRAGALTDEGATFLKRARRILADLRDAEQVVRGGRSVPRSQLHVTAPVMFGRLHVLPVIGALLANHEDLSARMLLLDRNVRIVEDGIDFAVRIGALLTAHCAPRDRIDTADERRQPCLILLNMAFRPSRPNWLSIAASLAAGGRVDSARAFGMKSETVVDIVPRLTINAIEAAIAAAEAGVGLANMPDLPDRRRDRGRAASAHAGCAPQPMSVCFLYDAGRAPCQRCAPLSSKAR